jgi:nucleoside-diphosphate-sugar epimerase
LRIVVTGGTGFFGRRLIPMLAHHELLLISRSNGYDLNDPKTWETDVAAFRPDACVYLAWEGLPDYSDALNARNMHQHQVFFDRAIRFGLQRIVVAGSCWEYGTIHGCVNENMSPVNPGNFALAKLAIFHFLQDLARGTDLCVKWARVFFAYGPGQRESSLLPSARSAARRGGNLRITNPGAMQDFIHVDDVARALKSLVEVSTDSGVYNIGSGLATTVETLVNMVSSYYGREEMRSISGEAAVRGMWADIAKLYAATGWKPIVNLSSGVQNTLIELDL